MINLEAIMMRICSDEEARPWRIKTEIWKENTRLCKQRLSTWCNEHGLGRGVLPNPEVYMECPGGVELSSLNELRQKVRRTKNQ